MFVTAVQSCQETVSQGKTRIGQGCESECFTLKPSSLASVEVNKRENAVRQGVKVPSPEVFAVVCAGSYAGDSFRRLFIYFRCRFNGYRQHCR